MAEARSTPSTTISGEILGGKYQILREMGSGSMGSVYEARHMVLGRRLAVKVLKQECSNERLKKRFFNEARAAGAITHQNIVQVYDFGLIEDTQEPYIVMEYVDGENLQDYMDREGAMPVEDSVEIVCQLLTTLDVIHAADLVHRDIKPSNMMLVKARRPRLFTKLLDFGIAKAVNEDWDWPTLTRVDEVLGTPVYLSPEQAMGGKADKRWDLWATAIMMYELLAGKLPFPTTSLIQITEDIVNLNLTPLERVRPDLPRWLLDVQKRALTKNQDERYQTATDFLHALEKKTGGSVGDTAEEEPVPAEILGDDALLVEDAAGDSDEDPTTLNYPGLEQMELPDDNSKTIPMERPPQFQTQPQAGPIPAPAPVPLPEQAAAPLAAVSTAQVDPMAPPRQAAPQGKAQWPIFLAIFAVFFILASVLGVLFFLYR